MTDDLCTVRDFFRYAVTSFTRAGLHFGHGAANAVDEAAFLVLEALSLPIDDINPWLDARLTEEERKRLASLIDQRVKTRKPAAYLVNKAYIHGVPFYVDERVIVPRCYIGEILASDAQFLPTAEEVKSVLDLCTGSGCLAILAAYAYPDAEILAVDLSGAALEVAKRNIEEHGLAGRIALCEGDLFAPLGDRKFDLILTNPPYVDARAIAAFPPEYRAEPTIAHAGGDDGLDIVRRIIADTPAHLNERGGLLCEFGTGRDILEAEYPNLPFFWPDTRT
jgi:ribosomal protein L3 glutamine methyltransferase